MEVSGLPLYPQEKELPVPFGQVGLPQSRSGHSGEEKQLLPLLGIEP
jgi:hypothetical protein